ncbi:hypothetical protein Dsin_029923 [Dipteronia sinensis]|uniref:Ubiquitin-like domain-containing protein n=1 Tax=Dipteronia sinensis TaxID=43782 RepID=A0AAE0DX63_9ROSI|nr:hypothetical protein Dsin_029923 [Dipteronia sinensis]
MVKAERDQNENPPSQTQSRQSNPSDEEIKLVVKVNKTIAMKVKKSEAIEILKKMIGEKEDILENNQQLSLAGRNMEDGRRIMDYGRMKKTVASLKIQSGATLQLLTDPKEEVTFSVETPSKITIQVEVKDTNTILDVKKIVESMTNFRSEEWDLFLGKRRLNNLKTLAFYDIKENDILKMLAATYQISVRTRTGKIVSLEVTQLDNIRAVKGKLSEKTEVQVNNQRVMFGK